MVIEKVLIFVFCFFFAVKVKIIPGEHYKARHIEVRKIKSDKRKTKGNNFNVIILSYRRYGLE